MNHCYSSFSNPLYSSNPSIQDILLYIISTLCPLYYIPRMTDSPLYYIYPITPRMQSLTPQPFYFKNGSLFLLVSAKPNSKQSLISFLDEESISVSIAAVAKDNAANQELLVFMGRLFGKGKRDVSLERGGKSRHKLVRVDGCHLALAEVKTLLEDNIQWLMYMRSFMRLVQVEQV